MGIVRLKYQVYILLAFIFAVSFTLPSCKSKQKVVQDFEWNPYPNRDKPPVKPKRPPIAQDTAAITDSQMVVEDTIVDEMPIVEDKIVVVMLPFMLDSLRGIKYSGGYNYEYPEGTNIEAVNAQIQPKQLDELSMASEIAVELYAGIQLAIDSLRKADVPLKVYVYDTKRDPFWVRRMLNWDILYEADIIIGPVYQKPAQAVAQFCADNEIYNVSPVSPSKKITKQNKFHVKLNPSIDAHASAMVNYIAEHYHNSPVLLLNKTTTAEIAFREHLDFLIRIHNQRNPDRIIEVTNVYVPDYEDGRRQFSIKPYLTAFAENVVIMSSSNMGFVNGQLRDLSAAVDQPDSAYSVTVFGMPQWKGSSLARYDYFQKLKVHVTMAKVERSKSFATQILIQRFKTQYHKMPTKEVFMGYDMMMYLGYNYMHESPLPWDEYFKSAKRKGMYNDIMLKPHRMTLDIERKFGEFDFYDNQSVNLYRFNDFSWQKAIREQF